MERKKLELESDVGLNPTYKVFTGRCFKIVNIIVTILVNAKRVTKTITTF